MTTNQPNDMIEDVFSDGFETSGYISALTLQKPGDNIHVGFWMKDERKEQGTNWELTFLLLGFIALRYWPVTLAIIFSIVLLVRHHVREKKAKKDADFSNS